MSRRNRRNIASSIEKPWSNWCRLCASECVSEAGGDAALKNKKGDREELTNWFKGLFSAQLHHMNLEEAKICIDCWKQMENLKHFVEHMEHVQEMYLQLDQYKDLSSKTQNWQSIVEAHLNVSAKQIKSEFLEAPDKEPYTAEPDQAEAQEKLMMEEYHLDPDIEEEYLQEEEEDVNSEYIITVEMQAFEQKHEAAEDVIGEDEGLVCYINDAEILENGNENCTTDNFQGALVDEPLEQKYQLQQQNLLPVQHHITSNRIKQELHAAETLQDSNHTQFAQCSKCDRTFSSIRALKRHQVVHGSAKFGCEECGTEFSCVTSLNVHIRRIHRKSKIQQPEEFLSDGEYSIQTKKKRRNWTHDINDVAKIAMRYKFRK